MSGNVDTSTLTVPASGVLQLSNANFLFILGASANATVKLIRTGLRAGAAQENYAGQLAGLQITRLLAWDFTQITAVAGTTVTLVYGNIDVREDTTLFNQQIAVISGVTAIAESPSGTFTDTADTAQGSGTQTVISANAARRRITIGCLSSSTNSIRVSSAGGTTRGLEIQPGMFGEFRTTVALTVRNDNTFGTGGSATWYAEEES